MVLALLVVGGAVPAGQAHAAEAGRGDGGTGAAETMGLKCGCHAVTVGRFRRRHQGRFIRGHGVPGRPTASGRRSTAEAPATRLTSEDVEDTVITEMWAGEERGLDGPLVLGADDADAAS